MLNIDLILRLVDYKAIVTWDLIFDTMMIDTASYEGSISVYSKHRWNYGEKLLIVIATKSDSMSCHESEFDWPIL